MKTAYDTYIFQPQKISQKRYKHIKKSHNACFRLFFDRISNFGQRRWLPGQEGRRQAPLVTSSPRTPVCVEDSSMSIFPSLLGNLNKPINAIHDRALSDGEIQKRQHRFGTVFFVR